MLFDRKVTRERAAADRKPTDGLQAPARVRELAAKSGGARETIDELIEAEQKLHAARGKRLVRHDARDAAAKAAWFKTLQQSVNAAVEEQERKIAASGDGSIAVGLGALIGAVVTIGAEYYFNRATLAALLELEGLAADMLAAGATAAMVALELPLLRLFGGYVRRHEVGRHARFVLYGVAWLVYLACAVMAGDLILHTAPAREEAVKLLGDVVGAGGELPEIDWPVVGRFLASLTVFVAGAAALLAATAHVELASAGARIWAKVRAALLRRKRERVEHRRLRHEAKADHVRRDLDERLRAADLEAEAWAQSQRTEAHLRLQPSSVDESVEELLRSRVLQRRGRVAPTPGSGMRNGRLLHLGGRSEG